MFKKITLSMVCLAALSVIAVCVLFAIPRFRTPVKTPTDEMLERTKAAQQRSNDDTVAPDSSETHQADTEPEMPTDGSNTPENGVETVDVGETAPEAPEVATDGGETVPEAPDDAETLTEDTETPDDSATWIFISQLLSSPSTEEVLNLLHSMGFTTFDDILRVYPGLSSAEEISDYLRKIMDAVEPEAPANANPDATTDGGQVETPEAPADSGETPENVKTEAPVNAETEPEAEDVALAEFINGSSAAYYTVGGVKKIERARLALYFTACAKAGKPLPFPSDLDFTSGGNYLPSSSGVYSQASVERLKANPSNEELLAFLDGEYDFSDREVELLNSSNYQYSQLEMDILDNLGK